MDGDFDRSGRALAKLDPQAFIGWLLGLTNQEFRFVRWLNARRDREPGQTERTNDRVAHLLDLEENGTPWATVIEFETDPENMDFGRATSYGAGVWSDSKPSDLPGDEFWIGVAVVYLRGKGKASRRFVWRKARMEFILIPNERNLSEEKARDTLSGVAAGTVPGLILAFVPLMIGGDDPQVLAEWRERMNEQSESQRGPLAEYTRVFAEAAGHLELWRASTEGWGVIRSQVADEWRAEGRVEGRVEGAAETMAAMSIRLLRVRFGALPPDLTRAISALTQLTRLQEVADLAETAASLDDFCTRVQL